MLENKRQFAVTLWTCAGLVFISIRPYCGFLFLMAAPFLLVWLVVSAAIMWRKPERRRSQALKVAIWCLAAALVGGRHWYLAQSTRAQADRAVAAIAQYQERNHAYPATLDDAGLDAKALSADWHITYFMNEGKPVLMYPATLTIFDTFTYEFGSRSWIYVPD